MRSGLAAEQGGRGAAGWWLTGGQWRSHWDEAWYPAGVRHKGRSWGLAPGLRNAASGVWNAECGKIDMTGSVVPSTLAERGACWWLGCSGLFSRAKAAAPQGARCAIGGCTADEVLSWRVWGARQQSVWVWAAARPAARRKPHGHGVPRSGPGLQSFTHSISPECAPYAHCVLFHRRPSRS